MLELENQQPFNRVNWESKFFTLEKGADARVTLGEPVEGEVKFDTKVKRVVQWRVYTINGLPVEKYWRLGGQLNWQLGGWYEENKALPIHVAVKRLPNGRYDLYRI